MKNTAPAATATRRDRLKQLRVFRLAVRSGSFSRAARATESSQPVVSNMVRTLEEDLGMALFHRREGRTIPTRAGENLYRIAVPLVENLLRLPDLFEEYYSGQVHGPLRVGVGQVSAAYLMPELVRRFRAHCPHVRIELRAGSGEQRLRWLRDFELDVLVGAFDDVPSDIEFHPIVESNAVVIMPGGHPLGRCTEVTIESLGRYPLILPPAGTRIRFIQDVVMGLYRMRPSIALEVDGWSTMIGHVAAGVGIAVVPGLCVPENGPVCMVPLRHGYRARTYGVAVRRDGLMGLAARRFVEAAVPGPDDGGEAP